MCTIQCSTLQGQIDEAQPENDGTAPAEEEEEEKEEEEEEGEEEVAMVIVKEAMPVGSRRRFGSSPSAPDKSCVDPRSYEQKRLPKVRARLVYAVFAGHDQHKGRCLYPSGRA